MPSLMVEALPHRVVGGVTVLILLALPALILLVPSGGSVPYHLLALTAILALLLRWPGAPHRLTAEERLASLGFAAFAVTVLLSVAETGFSREAVRDLDVLLRPLWAIPIIYLFVRVRPPEGMLWFGLSLGAVVAGLNALYEVVTAAQYVRAEGSTSAVTYGNTALAMGVMAAAGLAYFRRLGRAWLIVPAAALLLGLVASFLSGSRGGWLAIPFLALLLLWHYWQPRYRRLAIASVLAVVAAVSLALLLPQTGVKNRIDQAVTQVQLYGQDRAVHADNPVGKRLELWRAAWSMFQEQPLFGGGMGYSFNRFLREGIADGKFHPSIAVQTMPHNVVLDLLALRGLVGLVGVVVLWWALGRVFLSAARHPEMEIRALGAAGLALLLGYAVFGMTDSVMDYGPPLVFFCFYSALIAHLVGRARLAQGALAAQHRQVEDERASGAYAHGGAASV
ncbi:O-antigen ligase family protein [Thioalkalivibrio sp.]|uniref:O-antigen ligase family protein n=1 Tax=Thioalkalivibrio sp. TaxID=2093813 RepID=UPI003562EB85